MYVAIYTQINYAYTKHAITSYSQKLYFITIKKINLIQKLVKHIYYKTFNIKTHLHGDNY